MLVEGSIHGCILMCGMVIDSEKFTRQVSSYLDLYYIYLRYGIVLHRGIAYM